MYCIGNPRTDWLFKTEVEPGLNGRSILYPRGRVLGGCSSINGMIYMRGQAADYDGWAEITGDSGWLWKNMLPIFKGMENYHSGANEWHGVGGPWTVSKQRVHWEILDAFRDAAVEAGIPSTDDFNRGDNFGVGYFDVNQSDGWRLNASTAFLAPVAARRNLTVRCGAAVDRLLFAGEGTAVRCVGVLTCAGARLSARREVLLTAGAVGSVQVPPPPAHRLRKIPIQLDQFASGGSGPGRRGVGSAA